MIFENAEPTENGYRDADPTTVYAALGRVRVVDVREPEEAAGELGRIDGAELVPLATLGQAAERWDHGAEVVLVCRSGGRSARAAAALASAGFRRVVNMKGGMLAVRDAGLPVVR